MMAEAKQAGAVCLKSPNAYDRTLRFDRVPKDRAAEAFGKPRTELTPAQIKAFQDYIFWRLAELAAKHDLPFQIHTGHARIQGSNPMNLVDLIQANPQDQVHPVPRRVSLGRRVGHDRLEVSERLARFGLDAGAQLRHGQTGLQGMARHVLVESDHVGQRHVTVEGTYGATMYTRQCITEALAEKVVDKELREEDAVRIGRQILRENALKMFPSIRRLVEGAGGK